MSPTATLLACAVAATAAVTVASAEEPTGASFSIPIPDAERGRALFVNKGCVVCHSVNGVGGSVAPALDATEPAGVFDPLDFSARMWRGAAAMLVLQETEFGYQIELSGREIADLAAFAESHEQQQDFSPTEIPEVMRGWTIDGSSDRYVIEEAPGEEPQ